MVIFHSYVSLPEGKLWQHIPIIIFFHKMVAFIASITLFVERHIDQISKQIQMIYPFTVAKTPMAYGWSLKMNGCTWGSIPTSG